VVICGASGSGKSALTANWCRRFIEGNPDSLVIGHYIGSTSSSSELTGMLRRIAWEINERFGLEREIPTDSKELVREFPRILAETSNKGGCILVLDALDQLADEGQDLKWLPQSLPQNVTIVTSALPGRCYNNIKGRNWDEVVVSSLTEGERRLFVEVSDVNLF